MPILRQKEYVTMKIVPHFLYKQNVKAEQLQDSLVIVNLNTLNLVKAICNERTKCHYLL